MIIPHRPPPRFCSRNSTVFLTVRVQKSAIGSSIHNSTSQVGSIVDVRDRPVFACVHGSIDFCSCSLRSQPQVCFPRSFYPGCPPFCPPYLSPRAHSISLSVSPLTPPLSSSLHRSSVPQKKTNTDHSFSPPSPQRRKVTQYKQEKPKRNKRTNRIILEHTQRPMRSWPHKRLVIPCESHGDYADGDGAGFCCLRVLSAMRSSSLFCSVRFS